MVDLKKIADKIFLNFLDHKVQHNEHCTCTHVLQPKDATALKKATTNRCQPEATCVACPSPDVTVEGSWSAMPTNRSYVYRTSWLVCQWNHCNTSLFNFTDFHRSLIDVSCSCTAEGKGCNTSRCGCNSAGLSCTNYCKCEGGFARFSNFTYKEHFWDNSNMDNDDYSDGRDVD